MLGFNGAGSTPDARASFVNYTPYMGGDFEGKTFIMSNNNYVFVGFPSPQGLLGKARWLARVAVASFIDSPKSYKEVERAFEVRPNLGLIEYLFGRVREPPWASPIAVHLFSILKVSCNKPWPPAKRCFEAKRRNRRAHCSHRNRYNDLLVRGDVKSKAPDNLPLDARCCLNIEIEVFKTPRFDGNQDLFDAFVSTVMLVPLLLGLGKATNRGFGRFEPLIVDHEPSEEILNDIVAGKLKDGIKKFLKLWENAISSLGHRANLKSSWIDGLVPSLASTLDANYGAYVSQNKRSIDVAMEGIEKSVLKAEWKAYLGLRAQSSGINLHTWPLGLPRTAGNLGYLPAKENDNRCVDQNSLKRLWESKLFDGINARTLRRQSFLNLFPLPDGRIVILPFPAFDLNLNVDAGAPKARDITRDITLFHVGKHKENKFRMIKVGDIISNHSIEDPCKKNMRIGHTGVLDPQRNSNVGASFEKVLKTAYEWVKTLVG